MFRPPHTTPSTGPILAALLLAFGPLAGLLMAAGHDRGDLDQVRRRYGMALVRAVRQEHRPASLQGLVTRLEQAERDENWSDYYESAGRLLTALEGEEWSGAREQAFSLRVTLDHALVDPEGPIIVGLAQAFEPSRSQPQDWSVEVTLWRRALLGRGARLRRLGRIDRLDGELAVEPASPLQPGAYEIVGRLLAGHGVACELRSSAPFSVAPSFQDRCREVSSQRRRIEETLDEKRKAVLNDALLVARYREDLAGQMDRGLLTIQEIAVPRELGWAEQTLHEIEGGGLPLADFAGRFAAGASLRGSRGALPLPLVRAGLVRFPPGLAARGGSPRFGRRRDELGSLRPGDAAARGGQARSDCRVSVGYRPGLLLSWPRPRRGL